MNKVTEVQNLYAHSPEKVRAHFDGDSAAAGNYYGRYVEFVARHIPSVRSKVLEIGCGPGWSVLALRKRGYDVTGLDLPAEKPEAARAASEFPYFQGDALTLPFDDGSFDVITMHDVIEHVPDPEKALLEIARVLSPGGRFICVGPNLLGAGLNFYLACVRTLNCLKRGQLWEFRTSETPRHPAGDTMFEAWAAAFRHGGLSLRKLLFENNPRFLMRVPDDKPPFVADNDACYYSNPMDILKWCRRRGFRPLIWWAPDRKLARYLWPLFGGMWLAMEKMK